MDSQLRATVWSLKSMEPTAYIDSPKLLPPKGLDFSSNGKFMCILKKSVDAKNIIEIYFAGHDWKIMNAFDVPELWDPVDCKWVSNNTAIMVQDNPIESCFTIYNAMTGQVIQKHTPDSHLGLGIRSLVTSPNHKKTACGLYDKNLVIYDNLFLHVVTELEHTNSIMIDNQSAKAQPDIYKEE